MLVDIEILVFLTVIIYGGNFLLFKKLKTSQIAGLEKLAMIFGINMLLLLFSGGLVVIALLAG